MCGYRPATYIHSMENERKSGQTKPRGGAPMRFSLLMATVGRTEELHSFLASLREQTYRNFELLIVDQNPDDRLRPVLEEYEAEFPILHLRTDLRGLSRARNLGLELVNGELLAFPDDDCRYPPKLLATVAQTFAGRRELDGLTGRSVDEWGETSSGRFALAPGPVDRLNVWGRGISYTIFVRTESVRGLRFDEELGAGAGTTWGSGEETDYLLRLLERGGRIHYDPALVVVHPSFVPPYDAGARRKAYAYGCGMGYLLSRHGYPWQVKGMRLVRPLGGALLSAASLRVAKAGYHWSIFRGRLRGMAA
jgi:glycosyltransferase involved in cell wall biosynthesis